MANIYRLVFLLMFLIFQSASTFHLAFFDPVAKTALLWFNDINFWCWVFFSYGVKFLDQKEIAVKLKNVLNQFHCK